MALTKKFLPKKRTVKKYREGDIRMNVRTGRRERLTPDGTWKQFGSSSKTRKARVVAANAKKKAYKANKPRSIAKATIKGLPAAVRKIGGKLRSPFDKAIEQNIKQYQKRFRIATPRQVKIMKKFGKIK